MAFRFENLEIWQLAVEYSDMIFELIKKLPQSERFGLASDLNRASLSISTNIAEGSGSDTNKEFRCFIGIARKSIFETVSQLIIAKRRNYITEYEFITAYQNGELLVKKVSSFKNRLR